MKKRQFKKWIAVALAAAMLFGSVRPAQVAAAQEVETVCDEADSSSAAEDAEPLCEAEDIPEEADTAFDEADAFEAEDTADSNFAENLRAEEDTGAAGDGQDRSAAGLDDAYASQNGSGESQKAQDDPTASETDVPDESPGANPDAELYDDEEAAGETSEEAEIEEETLDAEGASDATETSDAEESDALDAAEVVESEEALTDAAGEAGTEPEIEAATGVEAFVAAPNVEVVPFDEVQTYEDTEVNPLYEYEIDDSEMIEPADKEELASAAAESAESYEVERFENATLYYDEAQNASILLYDDGTAVDVVADARANLDATTADALADDDTEEAEEQNNEASEETADEAANTEKSVSAAAVTADMLNTVVIYSGNKYQEGIEDAAAILREGMVNRQSTIQVYYWNTDTSNDTTVYKKLFDQATAHTGDPNEGDYLLWQYSVMSATTTYARSNTSGRSYYTVTYTISFTRMRHRRRR